MGLIKLNMFEGITLLIRNFAYR